MQPFKIIHAADRQSAIQAIDSDSGFIAGGTNLVDLMKMHVVSPQRLIDINRLDLDQIIPLPDGGLRIGALVRNSDLAYHPLVKKNYPVLSEALLSGASPQLRNMATVGGNLMQRTRCPYFYDVASSCNKRMPGSGCAALKGYNRTHAILGTSDYCIATHPSDMSVAMAALEATILVEGRDDKRTIAFRDFHLLPGDTPYLETALQQNELITAVDLPAPITGNSHYLKVRDRASYEFALTSAAVVMGISGNRIRNVKIALGGVGTKPWRALEAENLLLGSAPSKALYAQAAAAALTHARLHKDNAFKKELAIRTIIHALETTREPS